jgi:hypothetical protein
MASTLLQKTPRVVHPMSPDVNSWVIITDSLSTIIAVSDRKKSKNPKTQLIRKLIDQASINITLLRVPIHGGAAKETVNKETHHIETYPPQDLITWIKEKHEQEQQEKWENSTTTMKERKPHHKRTQTPKREQFVISHSRTGYTRATHSAVMDKDSSP